MLEERIRKSLEEKYKDLENAELLQIAGSYGEYEPEVIGIAEAELKRRNFPENELVQYKNARKAERNQELTQFEKIGQIQYFNISILKLVVLSICSFSIYEIYWFYRNWRAIKEQKGEDISPFWRGWFCLFTCWSLFKRIKVSLSKSGSSLKLSPGTLAGLYVIFCILGNFSAKMEGMVGKVCFLISFLSVIPLVMIQKQVNAYNAKNDNSYRVKNTFRWKAILVIVLGGAFLVFSIHKLFFRF